MTRKRILAGGIAAALVLFTVSSAFAQTDSNRLATLDDAELTSRLEFIETRLDGAQTAAQWWQWGWTTVYAGGVVSGTANAIMEDDASNRVNDIVTAAKGVIGTTRYLLAPLPARLGSSELASMPMGTREQKAARLAEAERLLRTNAHKAESRWDWRRHFFNAALNLVGGAFILGFGEDTDALVSVLLGVTVGEISILSMPQAPVGDLAEYERTFTPHLASAERNWRIVARPGGAEFQLTF